MAEDVLDLTVIGDRVCGTTRAYLTYLKKAGYRVKNLWLVDFGQESRRWRILRKFVGEAVVDALTGYRKHTAQLHNSVDEEYANLCLRLQVEAGFQPIDYFSSWIPEDYADKVIAFRAVDFNDVGLQARMRAAVDTAFLYTNGGIVPGSLLESPGLRIFHIHPGIVPDLRGSDCLLWSAAVRRKLGVSCFYMSAGIDEGEVIGQREFDLPRLPSLAPLMTQANEPMAYQALLFAVDPHLRASLFVDVLRAHSGVDLRVLPTRLQPKALRSAYLWMHPHLRLKTMREAFL